MNVYYANIGCEMYFTKKTLSVHQYWFNSSASFKFCIESGQWIKTSSACDFNRWEEAGELQMTD